jgi:hypothetical protein
VFPLSPLLAEDIENSVSRLVADYLGSPLVIGDRRASSPKTPIGPHVPTIEGAFEGLPSEVVDLNFEGLREAGFFKSLLSNSEFIMDYRIRERRGRKLTRQ